MAVETVTTTITYQQDINAPVTMKAFRAPLSKGDAKAHTFVIEAMDAGEEYDLTGSTVTAAFVNNTGATISFGGTAVGNKASVTLPNSCYNLPGQASLVVRLATNDEIRTILWLRMMVEISETGTIYDPDDEMDVATIQTIVTSAQNAATAATTAADNANSAASHAVRFDTAQSMSAAEQAQARSNIGLTISETASGEIVIS